MNSSFALLGLMVSALLFLGSFARLAKAIGLKELIIAIIQIFRFNLKAIKVFLTLSAVIPVFFTFVFLLSSGFFLFAYFDAG